MQVLNSGKLEKYHSNNHTPDLTTELCVLTDKQTASASEILLEALCDNGRAYSVGVDERTYGKNVAQVSVVV